MSAAGLDLRPGALSRAAEEWEDRVHALRAATDRLADEPLVGFSAGPQAVAHSSRHTWVATGRDLAGEAQACSSGLRDWVAIAVATDDAIGAWLRRLAALVEDW